MNTKIGIFAKTLLFLAGVFFWSVTVLATERPEPCIDPGVQAVSAERARIATAEAASEAADSIREATRLALDIRLIDRSSV